MANQEKNPPQQEQPFVAAKQVVFNLEDILLNTNNKVALLYPEHNNKDYFKCDLISFPNVALENHLPNHLTCIRNAWLNFGYHHQAEEETKGKGCSLHSILSLLIMHKMKEGYGNDEITLYPTQVFSVINWTLKPNQPKEPPITDHMLAICAVDKPVEFKAPKTSSKGATSEARANLQLSSGMSAFNLNEPIYSASFIIHSKSALRNDASAAFTAEADPVNSAPSDFVPQQQGMNEGTINTSYDHLFAGASSVASQIKEETSNIIKLEDPVKLVSRVQPSFKDLDSPEDIHYKLELEKNKAEAEANLLKAQPSFPNVEQLKELLVKSLKTKFSNILSAHDFSSSLPTKLKDLPSKFNDLTEEWELPAKFLGVPSQVEMVKAKLKTIDTLPSLLKKVTNALNHPPKGSSQTEGEHIKKEKGKKVLSSKEAMKKSTKSDSNDDETHLSGSMVESSRIEKVKKFDFVTKDRKHIHLTEEQINQQKKI
ncbi:hypothetical protein Tco_0659041 [Tanacetum coccineum]